ncbi:hypothetical protein BYT27DRAFT_7144097 [Phlegmacium glaucopus]|nr:hypothetical protein BYT27DRAFT_7144097 [Phlegmacium glaucopus]
MTQEIPILPGYPTTQDRKALSPSQVASLNQNIAAAISTILALPAKKRDTTSTRNFLKTYAKDTAFQTLQNLIWPDSSNKTPSQSTGNEKLIHQRSLLLAEKLASSSTEIGIELLLDLAIIYARLRFSQIQSVFLAAFKSNPSPLTETISVDLVPGFTALLSRQAADASQGLYAMRKVAECIFAFLRASGGTKSIPEFVRPFAYSKPFILAMASFYDSGLTAIASSYGGLSALTTGMSNQGREPDEWETIWVETKVALLDAFHIIVTALLEDLTSCPSGPRLAIEAERTFDIVFALLQIPSSSSTTITGTINADIPPTPFLNRPLLADYQDSYSLSKTLARALRHAEEKDVRLDLLENTLQSFNAEVENHDPDHAKERNPGALKILLRSSGVQPGIDNRGTRSHPAAAPTAATTSITFSVPNNSALNSSRNQTIGQSDRKGKGKAPPSDPLDNIDLDLKTTQVLDILPDLSPTYVRLLLTHDRYGGDAEKVVAALLEGTALSEADLEHDLDGLGDGEEYAFGEVNDPQDAEEYSLIQRRNIFDEEVMDVDMFRMGKKTTGEDILRDKAFIEEMKADILRRAEAISDDDEDEKSDSYIQGPSSVNKGKSKLIEIPDDDDAGLTDNVRVVGDGEESDVDSDEEDEEEQVKSPEVILELAYLRDPKVFERDAVTRRSKARTDLRTQTGWANEQIEGWKLMLERNPAQKEKMLQKHAFSGNEKGLEVHTSGESRGRGSGRPRGGRGRGGGRGGAGVSTGEDAARERAWKDKNKAARGNHNRKRGHDKKMARAMGGPGPST